MKKEKASSVVFKFERQKSENPGIRRRAQLTRRQVEKYYGQVLVITEWQSQKSLLSILFDLRKPEK